MKARCLVIQLARFGDIVQTRRLVLSLVTEYEVFLCVDKTLVVVAGLVFPELKAENIIGIIAHGNSTQSVMLQENFYAFAHIQTKEFSAVYNCNASPLNYALAALFDANIVHGHVWKNGNCQRDYWIDLTFRLTWQRKLAPLNLVDFWGLLAPKPIAPMLVNPAAKAQGNGIGVVLAGRMARRSLQPEQLLAFVQLAYEQSTGKKVFLLGTNSEKNIARKMFALLPAHIAQNTVDLTGKTSWHELAEVLQSLDLVLTPDTGTMHFAACLGVPTQAFFLASAWCWETGAYGKGHRVFQSLQECSPCVETQECTHKHTCSSIFTDKSVLRNFVKKQSPLQNMLSLETAFDAYGLIWQSTVDLKPEYVFLEKRRSALRYLVMEIVESARTLHNEHITYEFLQDSRSQLKQHFLALSQAEQTSYVNHVFADLDWMLPKK